jgi:hypothetical protein
MGFFPNTTNVSQRMDQGILKCAKLNYSYRLMWSVLANMEAQLASPRQSLML